MLSSLTGEHSRNEFDEFVAYCEAVAHTAEI